MQIEIDEIMLHILGRLSEIDSASVAGQVRHARPCNHGSDSVDGISYPGASWQDVDYRLKLMKYHGLLQARDIPDPERGIAYTCISALGRKIMLDAMEKRILS